MTVTDDNTRGDAVFEAERGRLRAVAVRMLGAPDEGPWRRARNDGLRAVDAEPIEAD